MQAPKPAFEQELEHGLWSSCFRYTTVQHGKQHKPSNTMLKPHQESDAQTEQAQSYLVRSVEKNQTIKQVAVQRVRPYWCTAEEKRAMQHQE